MKSFSFKILYISIFFPSILYVLTLPVLESQVQHHLENDIRQQLTQGHGDLLEGKASLYQEIDTNINSAERNSLAIKLGALVRIRVFDEDGAILYPNYERLILSLQQDKRLSPPPSKYFDQNGFFLPQNGTSWEHRQKQYFEFINGLKIETVASIPVTSWLGSATLLCYIFIVVVGLYIYFLRASRIEEKSLKDITQKMSQKFESEKQAYAHQLDQRLTEAQKRLVSIKEQEEEWLDEIDQLEKEKASLQTEKSSLEDELLDSLEQSEEQQEKLQSLKEEIALKIEKRSKSAAREEKVFTERFAKLYRNLEMDKAAVKGFVHLKDEKAKLTAEEMLKRLNDGDQTLKIRRKIAGVAGCDAYELGFGSKGRIYYIHSQSKQFRVVRIGTKTTQDKDLAAMQGLGARV